MGNQKALEMAEAVRDGLSLDAALHYHLSANHFPPVPDAMIPVCKAAIEAFQHDEPEQEIPLPEGISHRRTGSVAIASEVIESLHLDAFIPTCTNCGQVVRDGKEESGFTGDGPDWCTADGDFGCDYSPDTNENGVGNHTIE